METLVTTIQLTAHQAKKWVDKYYSCHLDYNIPVEERNDNNPAFNNKDTHKKNVVFLLNILTSPPGSEFVVDKKFSNKGPGSTKIWPKNQVLNIMIGFRDQSMEHVYLATTFLNAKTFGWFKHKMPL